MKKLTYADWVKNPVPRNMWVWDSSENNKKRRKVIYILGPNHSYPIVALSDDEMSTENFKHCAEIEKTRRMTNKELSRWLKEKLTREYRYKNGDFVYGEKNYRETVQDKEVEDDILIREDDGEWREPLVEVEE